MERNSNIHTIFLSFFVIRGVKFIEEKALKRKKFQKRVAVKGSDLFMLQASAFTYEQIKTFM